MAGSGSSVHYRLPISAFRFTGTRAVTKDAVKDTTSRAWESSAELVVVADEAGPELQASFKGGGSLSSTDIALRFSADGRLTSASSESTGGAIPLIKGVVVAGATTAGMLVGGPLGASAAGLTASRAAATFVRLAVDDGFRSRAQGAVDAAGDVPEDPVMAAYRDAHPEAWLHLTRSIERVLDAEQRLATVLTEAVADPTRVTLRTVTLHEEALALAQAELARRRQHFAVWRATTLEATSVSHEHLLTLDEVRAFDATIIPGSSALSWGTGGAPQRAQVLWDDLGILPVVSSVDGTALPAPTGAAAPADMGGRGVWVRRPRRVRVTLYRRVPSDVTWAAKQVSTEVYDVVDGAAELTWVPFRSSAFARRQSAVEFHEGGTLASYTYAASSSAEAVGTALGELPASVVSGLEQAGKLRDQVAALQDKQREQQLARAKREVELKQQELELAGLTATEADYAELKRLEQEATLLEKRRSVATASATSDEVAGEVARLTQQLELADARRAARIEEELRELKDALARLEVLAKVLEKPDDPDDGPDTEATTP
jgi:hypothetical protein